jgi:putative tryptophan/tyrosine transport system substrate-binding protein
MQSNATEMVNLVPDVIVASNTQTVEVLHRATRTVPIVFEQVADPVGQASSQPYRAPPVTSLA